MLAVAALIELTGGDTHLAADVLVDFASESRSDLASLRAGYESGDADELRRHAHRFNGASRTIGAHDVRDIPGRVEREAGSDDPDRELLGTPLDPLADALDRVAVAIDSRRERTR